MRRGFHAGLRGWLGRLAMCVAVLGLTAGAVRARASVSPVAMMLQQGAATAGEKSTPENSDPKTKEEAKDENDVYRHSPMVAKMGKMFGMSTEQAATAFTVFNFAILVIGVLYMLAKLLPKAFRTRNTTIQKQLVDARTATEEATARLNSVEDRLSKLDEQIEGMRKQAAAETARDEQRLRAGVEEDRAKIIAAAEAEIENAATQARRQIQRYAVELAVEQAARKLVISADTDRLLVEDFAKRLGDETSDKGNRN
jgi:F-type H+-transporting ATPase subunit b